MNSVLLAQKKKFCKNVGFKDDAEAEKQIAEI